jgi:hypothetical protein
MNNIYSAVKRKMMSQIFTRHTLSFLLCATRWLTDGVNEPNINFPRVEKLGSMATSTDGEVTE